MSKQVTVEEGSVSSPPLPNEPLPEASNSISNADASGSREANEEVVDTFGQGSNHDEHDVGGHDDSNNPKEDGEEDDDEEWDPAEERLPGQTSAKGKGKAVEGEKSAQPWQAVWAAEQNGQFPTRTTLAIAMN